MLDLANPAVQDFVFGVVDNLMTSYPEIDYIKWDANMSVQNHGSQYLTKDNQSHMYIEFHRGFEKSASASVPNIPTLPSRHVPVAAVVPTTECCLTSTSSG